jgi:hypothetical protein
MSISVDTRRTLRHYAGGWITIICRHCEHRPEMRVEDLARRMGWDTEIERPRRLRLKCTQCGHKGPALTVSYDRKPKDRKVDPAPLSSGLDWRSGRRYTRTL